jgi:hypothetical protein
VVAELRLDADGVYRVTQQQLRAAGIDLDGAPVAGIGLFLSAQPVPVRIGGPARFGAGSFVEFVGRAAASLYTRENVYQLATGVARPERTASDRRRPPRAGPARQAVVTRRFGAKRDYAFASPTGDPWFDTRMLASGKAGRWAFTFDAEGYAGPVAPVELDVLLFGGSDLPAAPDHHVLIALNGSQLGDIHFDGITERRVPAVVPPGQLRATGNELVLQLPVDHGVPFDLVHLQDYAVTYPRTLRAAGGAISFTAHAPAVEVAGLPEEAVVAYREAGGQLTLLERFLARPDPAGGFLVSLPGSDGEATYHLASVATIATPRITRPRAAAGIQDGRAELLIVSHPEFLDGLAPLVAARAAQGLSVKVVDVNDVYARYGGGVVGAQAIRACIAAAAATMGTRLVLLVGGDTYDYHGYLGTPARSFVPSLYAPIGDIVRFAPVDPAYGDLDGDGVAELAVGRLPVRTQGELDAVVAKTLAYERRDYARTAILVADRSTPKSAVGYRSSSELFAARLGEDWKLRRLYLDEVVPVNLRPWLIEAINGGAALTNFVGHSGPQAWTPEAIFGVSDVKSLKNAGRPTVVVQWGCWNSYYVSPQSDALGPALLLAPNGGAAATLGATTLAEDTSENALAPLLAAQLAVPGIRLGEAVLAAKRQLAEVQPGLVDVQLGWTLLGDPALVVGP